MPTADKRQNAIKSVSSGAATFQVGVIDGEIVIQALKEQSIGLGDVFVAARAPDPSPADALSVSAEIIAQAKGDKVIVFKKRRRHNYRKKGLRQQHTVLRIVAVSDKTSAANVANPATTNEGRRQASPSTRANKLEEETQLRALAVDLDNAANRMGESLNRAIESVRAALDPKREIAARKRFEAEFAGVGGNWLQGL